MARITVEDCLQVVGDDNRFNLIHMAVHRIRQHRQGEPFLVEGKNKEIVMTLREIAAGKVTPEDVDKVALKTIRNQSVWRLTGRKQLFLM